MDKQFIVSQINEENPDKLKILLDQGWNMNEKFPDQYGGGQHTTSDGIREKSF
ncbi:hypothetical protein [Paenibacillus luteus]|uniref:hypothetical protein n=1 Tax=Paenibacillus luteus TaxID=2545753 RepID=UPI001375B66D|nr:hypothetical protein [Paenibacillus luteus]